MTLVGAGFEYEWVMYECPVRLGMAFAAVAAAKRGIEATRALQLLFAQIGQMFSKEKKKGSILSDVSDEAEAVIDRVRLLLSGGSLDESSSESVRSPRGVNPLTAPPRRVSASSKGPPVDASGKVIPVEERSAEEQAEWASHNAAGVDALERSWSKLSKVIVGMPPSAAHAMAMWNKQTPIQGVPPRGPS